MFNLLKSSGTLNVIQDRNQTGQSESMIYNITFSNVTTGDLPIEELNGTLVNFSYEPTSNFWQDQGYQWQYGYINVTKYGGMLKTPLSYDTMDDVTNATESGAISTFAKSFVAVDYTVNTTQPQGGNCSSLVLWAVNITASPNHSFISSNGYGTLKLTSDINFTTIPLGYQQSVTNISFVSDQEPFGNATVDGLNESFDTVSPVCNNIHSDGFGRFNPELHKYRYDIDQTESPVNVTLNIVEIQIEAVLKMRQNTHAVSPVVGIMLMLVVTIIIAAVVSAFSGGLIATPQAPDAIFDVHIYAQEHMGVNQFSGFNVPDMTISEISGDAIPTRDLKITTTYTNKSGTTFTGNLTGEVSVHGNDAWTGQR